MISFQVYGTEKKIANKQLSTGPNSMISFKFYVKMSFFKIFITLHLGKGHIQAVTRHSGPESGPLTASARPMASGVDSYVLLLMQYF